MRTIEDRARAAAEAICMPGADERIAAEFADLADASFSLIRCDDESPVTVSDIERARQIVNAVEWSGDWRVNMTTAIGAGRVLDKALADTEKRLAAARGKCNDWIYRTECNEFARGCEFVAERVLAILDGKEGA